MGLGLLLVGVAVVLIAVTVGGDRPVDPSSADSSAAPTSSSAAPPSSGAPTSTGGVPSDPAVPTAAPTTDPDLPPVPVDELPPSQAPVGLADTGTAGDGVTGEITDIAAIDAEVTGPGNISGPALRVSVQLTNGSATAIPLDSVTVTMTYGQDAAPASPLDDPSVIVFGGSLAPGASADAVYVFSVPTDSRNVVSVQVSHGVGAPYMVFTGSLA